MGLGTSLVSTGPQLPYLYMKVIIVPPPRGVVKAEHHRTACSSHETQPLQVLQIDRIQGGDLVPQGMEELESRME